MYDLTFKVKQHGTYRGMTYIIFSSASGYYRCYIGIPQKQWHDEIIYTKFNKRMTIGDRFLKRQYPNLSLKDIDNIWMCFVAKSDTSYDNYDNTKDFDRYMLHECHDVINRIIDVTDNAH